MSISFLPESRELESLMIERRRDFHRNPELAFQEVRTAGIVAKTLTDLGLEVQTGVGKTGVVAMLEGDHDGPTLLVRADMDALPILEANSTDYISENSGVMHACGHDGHTSIGLAVAEMLTKRRAEIHGRIKFVFQPAEEIGEGARAMVSDGVLKDPRPDFSLGLHVWNTLPIGEVGVTPGPCMAACDLFDVKLTGYGSHAASPHEGHDPIVAAAHIVTALQSIVSRGVDPLDTVVISVTSITSGEAYNVIPPTATMKGTVRTYKKSTQEFVHQRMREVIEGVGKAMQCEVEFDIRQVTIAVNNNADLAQRVGAIAAKHPDVTKVRTDERTMGAEDVAFLMDDVPGCFFFVGSANAERDLAYPHHNPRFDIDERALVIGASLLAEAAASFVIPEK